MNNENLWGPTLFFGEFCDCFFSALTDLTVSSFNEDKFGVVQKSLPTIVTNLLQLLEASV